MNKRQKINIMLRMIKGQQATSYLRWYKQTGDKLILIESKEIDCEHDFNIIDKTGLFNEGLF